MKTAFLFIFLFSGISSLAQIPVLENQRERLGIPADMLGDYLFEQARLYDSLHKQQKSTLKTQEDWEGHQKVLQQRLEGSLGHSPPKSPLLDTVLHRIDMPDFTIEKLVFQSRENFYVTALVYVPKKFNPPYPAVIAPCGHSENGKNSPVYQTFHQALAKKGYLVLAYDPPGQGERSEYLKPDSEEEAVRGGIKQHCMVGKQCIATGNSLAGFFLWDGIRAVDYLYTRSDVDTLRIAVSGNSGGGTQTTYLAAMDKRIALAAPSCYITKLKDRVASKETADPEQNLPGMISRGLDHPDLLALFAPKPLQISAAEQDFFPFSGTLEAFREVQHIYADHNAIAQVTLATGDHPHGFRKILREKVYAWINQHFDKNDVPWEEPNVSPLPEDSLFCSPTGRVLTSFPHAKTVAECNDGLYQVQKDTALKGEQLNRYMQKLLETWLKPGLGSSIPQPLYTQLSEKETSGGIIMETGIVKTEEGIAIPSLVFSPAQAKVGEVVILIADTAKSTLEGKAIALAKKGKRVILPDLRGMGETKDQLYAPRGGGFWDGFTYYGWYGRETDYAYTGLMLDRPLPAMRAFDILQVISVFQKRWSEDELTWAVYGQGQGALAALLAANLSPELSELLLEQMPASLENLVESGIHQQTVNTILPTLPHVDYPQLAARVNAKTISIYQPVTANMELLPDLQEVKKIYRTASKQVKGSPSIHFYAQPWEPDDN